MDLKFRKKGKRVADRELKLPLTNEKVIGIFNGLNVVIHDWSSMILLYNEGCFGKGTFSKREPSYNTKKDDVPKIIFSQQVKNQSKWSSTVKYVCPKKNCPVRNQYELSMRSTKIFFESSLSNSDAETQNFWLKDAKSQKGANVKQELSLLEFHSGETYSDEKLRQIVNEILQNRCVKEPNICSSGVKNEVIILSPDSQVPLPGFENIVARLEHKYLLPEENLNLNWEEALYLKSTFGCLIIVGWNERNLTDVELWEKFKQLDKNFVVKYVTYHYYRSKGWIVRSGVKFGGDYLLYKIGPAYFHASYVIKVLDDRKISWRELMVNNRLSETSNKEVIFVRVSSLKKGNDDGQVFPELLENYKVEETLVKRWLPSKERKSKKKM